MNRQSGAIPIGISGWTYARWRGVFLPESHMHARELAYATQHFRSVEINVTFYRLHAGMALSSRPFRFSVWIRSERTVSTGVGSGAAEVSVAESQ